MVPGAMKSRRAYGPLPPGPRAPAAVNMARLVQRPLESLLGWRERYGDVFTVRCSSSAPASTSPTRDAIRELFTGDQSDLHAGEANAPLAPVLGDNSVLVLDGRRAPAPAQAAAAAVPGLGACRAFREVIREVAEAEVDALARRRAASSMRERMRALTFEVICRAVFGVTEPRADRAAARARSSPCIDMQHDLRCCPSAAAPRPRALRARGARSERRLRAADALLYEEIARRRARARPRGAHRRALAAAARPRRGRRADDATSSCATS